MTKEIFISPDKTIEDVIYMLLLARINKTSAYCRFNDKIYYSDNIEKENDFKEIISKFNMNFDKIDTIFVKIFKSKLELEKAKKQIPIWLAKGNELIFPEKYTQWETYVVNSVFNMFHGKEVDATLQIIECLKNNSDINKAIEMFNSINGTTVFKTLVRELVFCFSNRGPDFWIDTNNDELSHEAQIIVELKRQENIRLMNNCKIYTKK